MDIRNLSERFAIGGQIDVQDVAQLKSLGFTDIVCNRPDAEVTSEQSSTQIASAAEAAGVRFHYIPISSSVVPASDTEALAEIMQQDGSKVFAYCRSGARSSMLWSLAGVD